MKKLLLNADLGESFGAWPMGNDAALLPLIDAANIACGFHAGDATVIRQTIQQALAHGVLIGAHPSYPDLQGFGRREMQLTAQEVYDVCLYQIAALKGITEALGGRLHHVKPHGALYNVAARTPTIARAIAEAVKAIDPDLKLMGLAQSHLISEAEAVGLATYAEAFADRTYQSDGSLTPRSQPNALIHDTQEALQQVKQLAEKGEITAVSGQLIQLRADTLCIHGDGPQALAFAQTLRHFFDS